MRRLSIVWPIIGIVTIAAMLYVHSDLHLDALRRAFAPLVYIDPRLICLIVGLNLLSFGFAGALWTRIARALGDDLPFQAGLVAYLSAGIGGYMLSVAGPAVGCAIAVRRYGLPAGRAVLLATLACALGFCGLLVWAPLGLIMLGRTGSLNQLPVLHGYGPLAGAILLVILLGAMLIVLRALAGAPATRIRIARRLLGSDGAATRSELSTMRLLALVPWAAVTWLSGAGILYIALSALNPTAAHQPLTIIGAAALAGMLGSLVFFVPQGLGVKDGVLLTLLAHGAGLPISQTIGVVLALRLLDPVTKLGLLMVLGLIASRRWVQNPDGTVQSRLTPAKVGLHRPPAWSTDLRRIAHMPEWAHRPVTALRPAVPGRAFPDRIIVHVLGRGRSTTPYPGTERRDPAPAIARVPGAGYS